MVRNSVIDVEIDDKIRIHADGMVLIVHASDVVESVREFNFLHSELERLRSLGSMPLAGTVLPDGSVQFRGDQDVASKCDMPSD